MAVYQQPAPNGKPRWMVDFVWVDPSTGRKKRIRRAARDAKGRPATSETAAEKAEHTMRTALATGTFEPVANAVVEDTGAITLKAFQERYFRDHVSKLKASSQSAQSTIWRVSLLPTLGETPLDQIDAEALAKLTSWLRERGSSPKTVNNALSGLRTALTHAEDWKLLKTVPRVRWLKVPQQKFDFFTFEETTALLAHAHPMVTVAIRTGMRLGELLALKWSDVSFDRKQVTVARSVWWAKGGKPHEGAPKNDKVRTIPLTADAIAALQAQLAERREDALYVFANAAGVQMTKGETKWPLWRAEEAAGLRTTGWHVMRHSFCSHLAMRSVPIPAIQQLAGHSTIAMTMRYAHLAPDHLRGAIAALEV